MLIRNVAALLGDGLEYAESVCVRVEGGVFAGVCASGSPKPGEDVADCQGLLMAPGFINCHTHIGDSIAKDAAPGTDTMARVHPVYGAKARVLGRTSTAHLEQFMEISCRSMLAKGITTFADFREGGAPGVGLARRACRNVPIHSIILGRPGSYQSEADIRENRDVGEDMDPLVDLCDGLGISGANENSDAALLRYSGTGKIRAVHAAETAYSVQKSIDDTGRGEVDRALQMKPHFLVHMGHATKDELLRVAPVAGVVACPRSNAVLGGTIPDISEMRRCGCTMGLGTDNVMVNPPDMFREMDFAWKAAARGRLAPREILRMATVNGGRILGINAGSIRRGAAADYILVDRHHADLEPVHDPHAALVHRASAESIRAVAVAGRVVHGSV